MPCYLIAYRYEPRSFNYSVARPRASEIAKDFNFLIRDCYSDILNLFIYSLCYFHMFRGLHS